MGEQCFLQPGAVTITCKRGWYDDAVVTEAIVEGETSQVIIIMQPLD